jgi:hypothetical protein
VLPVAPADAELQERRVPSGVHGVQEEGHGDAIQVYVVLLERVWILCAGPVLRAWEGSEGLSKENRELRAVYIKYWGK